MLQRVREWLTLILLFLLPLHALVVTAATKLIAGPGHAPIKALAFWKEATILLLVFLAVFEIIRSRDEKENPFVFDALDWLILAGLLIAAVVSISPATVAKSGGLWNFLTHFKTTSEDKRFLTGLKYDFFPLIIFFILRRTSWSENFFRYCLIAVSSVGILAAVYGITTLFLPAGFFATLGYSDAHSLYVPTGPLAAFQFIENTPVRRIQSSMSGPNQFGIWLLIPFSMLLVFGFNRLKLIVKKEKNPRLGGVLFWFLMISLFGAALLLTFSRAAWIGAAFVGFTLFVIAMRRAFKLGLRLRPVFAAGLVLILVLIAGISGFLVRSYPNILLRTESFAGHIEKPLNALEIIKKHPFGMGLGSAGPASNALSDACVFLPSGTDYSWAKDRKDICVFVGNTRRIPADRACDCPLLTENWYLQWGVEMGVLGLMVSVAIAVFVIIPLLKIRLSDRGLPFMLGFLGISIAGLFLHAFEDSAVAYSIWVLLAAVIPQKNSLKT